MYDPVINIVAASYHRNGVSGLGFYAVLFDDAEHGRMIASLFEAAGTCAVYNVEQLAQGNIAFAGGNSWRGDQFEPALREQLPKFLKTDSLFA